jgi:hypothetical protein
LALRLAGALTVCACAALCACGNTERSDREAIIAAALRKLQAEYSRVLGAARVEATKRYGSGSLGVSVAVYAPPPKGVTAAEWQAAIKKDRVLQREFRSTK